MVVLIAYNGTPKLRVLDTMPVKQFPYYCYVCGHLNQVSFDVPKAPEMKEYDVRCSNEECQDATHILVTSCPHCDEGVRYFLSDLDFTEEVKRLSGAYVQLIRGIKKSLDGYIEEFSVALPRRWTVKLQCSCGQEYSAEIPLEYTLD
jgi:hypothetical protein